MITLGSVKMTLHCGNCKDKGKIKVSKDYYIDSVNCEYLILYECKTCKQKYYAPLGLTHFIDMDRFWLGLEGISQNSEGSVK